MEKEQAWRQGRVLAVRAWGPVIAEAWVPRMLELVERKSRPSIFTVFFVFFLACVLDERKSMNKTITNSHSLVHNRDGFMRIMYYNCYRQALWSAVSRNTHQVFNDFCVDSDVVLVVDSIIYILDTRVNHIILSSDSSLELHKFHMIYNKDPTYSACRKSDLDSGVPKSEWFKINPERGGAERNKLWHKKLITWCSQK